MYTILSIDDDVDELAIISNVLETEGFKTLSAEDGETGIACAVFAKPDLILLDVCMPTIGGFEVCRKLRENKYTCEIPIIFKTCLSSSAAVIGGFRAGTDDFIVKPCDHDELVFRIRQIIGKTPAEIADATVFDLLNVFSAQS